MPPATKDSAGTLACDIKRGESVVILTPDTEHTRALRGPQGAQAACAAEGGQTPLLRAEGAGPTKASHLFELEHSTCPTRLHPAETRALRQNKGTVPQARIKACL